MRLYGISNVWLILLLSAAAVPARLASTKAQEARMVKIAASTGEKWRASPLGDAVRGSDSVKAEIAQVRRQIGDYEGGILDDMNISADIAAMLVSARRRDVNNIQSISGFDSAAARLSPDDQMRYFCAKARIHAGFIKTDVPQDSILLGLELLVGDYANAVKNGFEVKKGIAAIRRQLEDAGFKNLFLDEFSCRLYQASIPWTLKTIKTLHAQRKDKDAVDLAVKTVREIPLSLSLKPGECSLKDAVELQKHYDLQLIQPACKALGTAADPFLVRICGELWNDKGLILTLLPRLRLPSKEALELLRRAGEDDALKGDKAVALAEVALWKKAGKLKQFRAQYPQRYNLAVPQKARKR